MRVTYKTILENEDMGSDFESPSIQLNQDFGYSVQAVWEGTPTGMFDIEVSNDQDTWIPIENSDVTVVAEDGHVMWNAPTTQYQWARLTWVGSGSGSVTVKIFIRGF